MYYFLRGLTCVPVIDTHMHQKYQDYYLDTIGSSWTADLRPASPSALFLRVPQAEPCRRPDNGSYPLSAGVLSQVYIWVPPTSTNNLPSQNVLGYLTRSKWISTKQQTQKTKQQEELSWEDGVSLKKDCGASCPMIMWPLVQISTQKASKPKNHRPTY